MSKRHGLVCPAKCASFLVSGIRKFLQNPYRIIERFVNDGETAVDLGCGPGFFTLPMAEIVGDKGCVYAVDLQQGMLDFLRKRAQDAGLDSRIKYHKCESDRIGLHVEADFVLALYMVHEVPNQEVFIKEAYDLVKPGGRFLLVEPKFHVSKSAFEKTVELARSVGFESVDEPKMAMSRSVLFKRVS